MFCLVFEIDFDGLHDDNLCHFILFIKKIYELLARLQCLNLQVKMHQNWRQSFSLNSKRKDNRNQNNIQISKRTREFLLKAKASFQNQHLLSSKQIKTIGIAIEFEIKRLQRKTNNAFQKQSNQQLSDNCLTLGVLRNMFLAFDKANIKIQQYQSKSNIAYETEQKSSTKKPIQNVASSLANSIQNVSSSRIKKTPIQLSFQQLSNIKTIAVLLKNEQYRHCQAQINNFIEWHINLKSGVSGASGEGQFQNRNLQIIQDYFYQPILSVLKKQIRQQKELQAKNNSLNILNRSIEALQMLIAYNNIDDLDSTIKRILEANQSENQEQVRNIKHLAQKIKSFHKQQTFRNQQLLGQLAQVNEQLQSQMQEIGKLQLQNQKLKQQVSQQKEKLSQQKIKISHLQKRLIIAQVQCKQLGLDQKQIQVQTEVIASLQLKLQNQIRSSFKRDQERQRQLKVFTDKEKALKNQIKVHEKDSQQLKLKISMLQKTIHQNNQSLQAVIKKQPRRQMPQKIMQLLRKVIQKIGNQQDWIQLIQQQQFQRKLLGNRQKKQERTQVQQIITQSLNCIAKQVKIQWQRIKQVQQFNKQSVKRIKKFKQQVERDFQLAKSRINSPKSDSSGSNSQKRVYPKVNDSTTQYIEYIDPGQVLDNVIKSFRQKYDDLTTQLFQTNAWVYVQTIEISEYLDDQDALVQILQATQSHLQKAYPKQHETKFTLNQDKPQNQFSQVLIEAYQHNLNNKAFKQLTLLGLQIRNFMQNCLYLVNYHKDKQFSCKMNKIQEYFNDKLQWSRKLQVQKQQLQSQLDTLQAQLKNQKSLKREIENKNKQALRQINQLNKSLKSHESQFKRLLEDSKKQNSSIINHQNQNQSMKQQLKRKQTDVEQLRKKNSQFIFQVKTLTKQNKQLQKQVQSKTYELGKTKQDNLKLQSSLKNLQTKQKFLDNQNKDLQKKLSMEIRQRTNQEKIVKQLESQIKQSAVYVSKLVQSRAVNQDSSEQQLRRQQSKYTIDFSHLDRELDYKQSKIKKNSEVNQNQQKIRKDSDSLLLSDYSESQNLLNESETKKQRKKQSISSIASNTNKMLDRIYKHDEKERLTISSVKKWLQSKMQEQDCRQKLPIQKSGKVVRINLQPMQSMQQKIKIKDYNQILVILEEFITKQNANAKHQEKILLVKVEQQKEELQHVRSELLKLQQRLNKRQTELKESNKKIRQIQKQQSKNRRQNDQLSRQLIDKEELLRQRLKQQKQFQLLKSKTIQVEVANEKFKGQISKAEQLVQKYQQDKDKKQSTIQSNNVQIEELKRNNQQLAQKYKQAVVEKACVEELICKFRVRLYMSCYRNDCKLNQRQNISNFDNSKRKFFISYPDHPLTMLIKQYQEERDAILQKLQTVQTKQENFEKELHRIVQLIRFDSEWVSNPTFMEVFQLKKQSTKKQANNIRKLKESITSKQSQQIQLFRSKTDPSSIIVTQIIGMLYRSNRELLLINIQVQKLKEQQLRRKIFEDKVKQKQILTREIQKQLKSTVSKQNIRKQGSFLVQQLQRCSLIIKNADVCLFSIFSLMINILREAQSQNGKSLLDKQKQASNNRKVQSKQVQEFNQRIKRNQQVRKVLQLESKLNSITKQFDQVDKWNLQLQRSIQLKQKQHSQFQIQIENLENTNNKLLKQSKYLKDESSRLLKQKQQKQKAFSKTEALLESQNRLVQSLQSKVQQLQASIQTLSIQLKKLNQQNIQIKNANMKAQKSLVKSMQQSRQNQFIKRIRQQQINQLQSQSKQKFRVLNRIQKQRTEAQIQINRLRQQLQSSLQREANQKTQRQNSQQKLQKQKYELLINTRKQKQTLLKTMSTLKLQKSIADQQLQSKNSQQQKHFARVKKQNQLFKKVLNERDQLINQLKEKILALDQQIGTKKKQSERQIGKLKRQLNEVQEAKNSLVISKQWEIQKRQNQLSILKGLVRNKSQNFDKQDRYFIDRQDRQVCNKQQQINNLDQNNQKIIFQKAQDSGERYLKTNQTSIQKRKKLRSESIEKTYNYLSFENQNRVNAYSRDWVHVNTSAFNGMNQGYSPKHNASPMIKIIDSRIINSNSGYINFEQQLARKSINRQYIREQMGSGKSIISRNMKQGELSFQNIQRSRSKNYRYIRLNQQKSDTEKYS